MPVKDHLDFDIRAQTAAAPFDAGLPMMSLVENDTAPLHAVEAGGSELLFGCFGCVAFASRHVVASQSLVGRDDYIVLGKIFSLHLHSAGTVIRVTFKASFTRTC